MDCRIQRQIPLKLRRNLHGRRVFLSDAAVYGGGKAMAQRMELRVVLGETNAQPGYELARQIEKMGMELCGVASDGEAVMDLVEKCMPDVLLMNMVMPKMDGLSMLRMLRKEQNHCRVLILSAYSDFNYALYTEPNRVVLTTNWDTLQSAELKKNTALRVRGGVKSEVLQNLEKGTKVTVLEEMENWDQVQTQDGYIGYVQKKHLTDPAEETPVKDTGYVEPDYTGNLRDHKIDLAWHQVTVESANSTFPGVMSGVTGVNVISPTWYSLYDNTGVVDGIASPSYVQQAHALGLEVWALIDDFTHREDNGVDPQEILSYTSKRTAIIEVLMSEADRCGFDGINVDFEKVTEDGSQDYIQFIRELSVACRQKGLVLSVDNYVPHNYNAHYKWAEQGVMADYVIIMGYDEHWGGSEVAGSVASLGYVTEGIKRMTQEVPSEKVINAVPLYTRIWTTAEDGAVTSRAVGIQTAYDYMNKNQAAATWDNSVGQNYVEFETSDGTVQIWLEDEQSLEAKINVMKEHNLGGIAAWKLGFDDGRKNIWGVISGFAAE